MRPKHLRYIHLNVNMIVDLTLAVHNNVVGFSLVKCDPLPSAERKVEKSGGREVMLLDPYRNIIFFREKKIRFPLLDI